jgi:hypothetical protein
MHVRVMAGLWHMDCNLVEHETGDEQPPSTREGWLRDQSAHAYGGLESAIIASTGASERAFPSSEKITHTGRNRSCAVFYSSLG